MNEQTVQFLSLLRLPGRLTSEQAAPVLGFSPRDIPVLVKAKILKPLGNPPPNAVKYFASADIEKYARDQDWLNRATKAIYAFWVGQNKRRRSPSRNQEVIQLPAVSN